VATQRFLKYNSPKVFLNDKRNYLGSFKGFFLPVLFKRAEFKDNESFIQDNPNGRLNKESSRFAIFKTGFFS
jgi:hypothetical protein